MTHLEQQRLCVFFKNTMALFSQPLVLASNLALVGKINKFIVGECWGTNLKLKLVVGDAKGEGNASAKLSLVKDGKVAISSQTMKTFLRGGKYWVLWNSHTSEDFRRLKYNLFLRAVSAIIVYNTSVLVPSSQFMLATYALNVVSGKIGIKYFGMKSVGPLRFVVWEFRLATLQKKAPRKFELFARKVSPAQQTTSVRQIRTTIQENLDEKGMSYYKEVLVPAWTSSVDDTMKLSKFVVQEWPEDEDTDTTHSVMVDKLLLQRSVKTLYIAVDASVSSFCHFCALPKTKQQTVSKRRYQELNDMVVIHSIKYQKPDREEDDEACAKMTKAQSVNLGVPPIPPLHI